MTYPLIWGEGGGGVSATAQLTLSHYVGLLQVFYYYYIQGINRYISITKKWQYIRNSTVSTSTVGVGGSGKVSARVM